MSAHIAVTGIAVVGVWFGFVAGRYYEQRRIDTFMRDLCELLGAFE